MSVENGKARPADRVGALVIGGGPAGLMAAETMAAAGRRVVVAEAMPTTGRKLLMAGKSGLNLTRMEGLPAFVAHYAEAADRLGPIVGAFGPEAVRDWAEALGQATFAGSTGRLFPRAMKASPLLRTWLRRLDAAGVSLRTGWRWTGGLSPARFATPDGTRAVAAAATVLALGGASWRRLGSNGAWAPWLIEEGVEVARFAPSNVGLDVRWSGHMHRHFGAPLKAVAFAAGGIVSRGEAVISERGLEGGGLYRLTPALRLRADLTVDLTPDLDVSVAAARLSRRRGKLTLSAHLRRALRLDPVRLALLNEFGRPLPGGDNLARLVKALPIRHAGLRPLDEAISTAGGVRWSSVDDALMLKARPGVFVAGEMLDWEAPTGGYLLTACLATGRWSGAHAARWLSDAPSSRGGSASAR